MNIILGALMVIICVFGGFIMANGQLAALWHPPELVIIAGGALGGLIIGNPPKVIKTIFGNIPLLIKGSPYTKRMYMDLLALLYELFMKARKEG
ncbi:MAG: flagellar motor stator protein MotA, partial [Nitrosomonas sp.]|nr:flagellar motor stator protein MotA [Nitrosomonas sp.]